METQRQPWVHAAFQWCQRRNPANQEYNLEFQVVKKGVVPILGAAAELEMGIISLHPYKIFMHSIQQTRTGPTSRLQGEPATRELLINLYPAVFQDKIGCLQGELALDLNENATPACPDIGTASAYHHEGAASIGTRTLGRIGNY